MVVSSKDADELEAALAAEGIRFRSRRRMRRWVRKAWRRANADEIARLRASVGEPFGTATASVQLGSVTYRICGIAHGQRRFARPSDRTVATIADWIRRSEALPARDYATERGMARLLGLPRSKELDYGSDFIRSVGGRGIAIALLRFAAVVAVLPLFRLLIAFSRDPATRHIGKALDDPDQIAVLQALYAATELPPSIATGLATSTDRFRIAHSEAIARALVDRAQRSGVSEMVGLVGVAHVAEVVWFIDQASR